MECNNHFFINIIWIYTQLWFKLYLIAFSVINTTLPPIKSNTLGWDIKQLSRTQIRLIFSEWGKLGREEAKKCCMGSRLLFRGTALPVISWRMSLLKWEDPRHERTVTRIMGTACFIPRKGWESCCLLFPRRIKGGLYTGGKGRSWLSVQHASGSGGQCLRPPHTGPTGHNGENASSLKLEPEEKDNASNWMMPMFLKVWSSGLMPDHELCEDGKS